MPANKRSKAYTNRSTLSPNCRNASQRATGVRSLTLVEHLESRVLLSASPLVDLSAFVSHLSSTVVAPEFRVYSASSSSPDDTTAPTGLSPQQIRQAYGINLVGTGAGQTIAIVDAYNDPNITADLHTFDVQFGLSDPTLTVLNENGGTSLPGTDPSGRGNSWAIEISLDVEWAHAAAPGAKIVLIEASSDYDSDLMTAVNTARNYAGVSVVSMSWGGSESSSDTSQNSSFTTPAGHTGVTFVASSGDNGAYGSGTSQKIVEYPAASPNIIAVGGTTLSVDSSGNYLSETAWGNGTRSASLGGSGGGISLYETQPAYQNGVVTQTSTARALPDVALDADPNSGVSVVDSWDSPSSPWFQVGGTSMAAPIWAGIIAIANQGRAAAGEAVFTGTQALSAIYSVSSSDYHDITSGSNGYSAGTGYDLVTGRGTPIVNKLIPDLVAYGGMPVSGPTIGSFADNPSSAVSGATVTLTASNVLDSSATISSVKFYRETNGTAGLQTASDTLIGTGTQNGSTWTINTSTSGFAGGSYTYYAIATDSAGKTITASTSLTIVTPTISSLGVSPSSTTPGATVTLTASNAVETGGNVASVTFYRESNGSAGLQTASDTLVGTGTKNGNNWTISFSTAGMALGTYTYYAVAKDSAGLSSNVVSGTLIVTSTNTNDNFANAYVLTGASASATGTNVGATRESAEPYITGNVGGHSVWWTWTAPSNGKVTIDTSGSNFDTMLGVYTGSSVSALTLIAQNDDASRSTLTSSVTFNAVAGTQYHIAVDGYNGATGSISLHLSQVVAPANDSVNTPTLLSGASITWTGSNVGATRDPGQPLIAGNSGGASIWFKWTATTSSTVTLTTAGSNFDTILGVFLQTSPTLLQLLASNDDVSATNRTSALTFNAVAGNTYYFIVDGYNGATGNVALNLKA